MRDDDGVPISGGDAAEKFLAVLRLKILPAGDEDVCARIQREQLGRELAEHVVWHSEHRLARKAEPLQLHRGGDHGVGFARADDVGEQCVRRLQNPPDTGLLMLVKLNRLACAGQCQVIAVEGTQPGVVERVVVETAKPLAPRIVRPDPFFELFLDAFLLLAGSLGRLRIDDGLFVRHVIHGGRLEIERVLDQFQTGVAVCAPIRRVGGRAARLPIRVNMPGTERVDVPNFDAG